jgi:XTP/dITP diphosphohydrolase
VKRSPKPLLLGTQNPGKIAEFRSLLGDKYPVQGLGDCGIQVAPLPETGATYFENSLAKALGYQALSGLAVLADDSGLEVDVLGGAPGVFTADLGGPEIPWPERWAVLWQMLRAYPEIEWTARFRCVLCFYDSGAVPRFFDGVAEGKILPLACGSNGFGYDPIFFSSELGKGFAEATQQEKNRVSARAKALRSLREWLDHQAFGS